VSVSTGRRTIAGVLAVLLVALVAYRATPAAEHQSARPRAAPKRERPVPFAPGEVLAYDVSWSTFVTAGSATVSVKEKKPSLGSVAYYIVAEGRPTAWLSRLYNLYYRADTLLDAYTLLPQRGSVYSEEGGRRRTKTTTFDQAGHKAAFEVQTATTVNTPLALPAAAQDALSAIYVLRAAPIAAQATMTVADNGRVLNVRLTPAGRERVGTGIGPVEAVRISPVILDESGQPEGRTLSLWLSDDARRLPVKLQADLAVGSFVLTLKSIVHP
jgi:uncharacterized protein DUF3108